MGTQELFTQSCKQQIECDIIVYFIFGR